jgi:hypothetical protein
MLSSFLRNCCAGAAHLSGCAGRCQSCIAGDAVDFWYCALCTLQLLRSPALSRRCAHPWPASALVGLIVLGMGHAQAASARRSRDRTRCFLGPPQAERCRRCHESAAPAGKRSSLTTAPTSIARAAAAVFACASWATLTGEGERDEAEIEQHGAVLHAATVEKARLPRRVGADDLGKPGQTGQPVPAEIVAPRPTSRAALTSAKVRGRGTALNSPRRMLMNCGSSSSPVARNPRPTRSTRPSRMERNLRMVKGRRRRPRRCWPNSTGRPSSSRIAKAMTAIRGANKRLPG